MSMYYFSNVYDYEYAFELFNPTKRHYNRVKKSLLAQQKSI